MEENALATAGKVSPGRPRSTDADQAILQAALQLLVEGGYARMSMEGVAAAAGVGKTTIYRRYAGKQDLVVAVIDHFFPVHDLPTTGDTWEDVNTLLTRAFPGLLTIRGVRLIGIALAEEEANPDLFAFILQKVIQPRRMIFRAILERGVARGDVRSDADLDLAVDMTLGAFIARQLSGGPTPDDWLAQLVAALKRLLAVTPGDTIGAEAGDSG